METMYMTMPNIQYTRSRKLIGLHLVARNVPGVIAEVAGVLGRANLNVISLNMSSLAGWGEHVPVYIAVDASNASFTVEEIVGKLQAIEEVREVRVVKPQTPQVLVDPASFPIIDPEGSRLMILSEHAMKAMVVDLRRRFGTGGLAFLYHQGMVQGEILAEKYARLGARNLEEALKLHLLHMFAYGRYYGRIVGSTNLTDEAPVTIVIQHSWECETARKYGVGEASNHFERGVIAGLVRAYTGERVVVEETECIASSDESCKLIIKSIEGAP